MNENLNVVFCHKILHYLIRVTDDAKLYYTYMYMTILVFEYIF